MTASETRNESQGEWPAVLAARPVKGSIQRRMTRAAASFFFVEEPTYP